MKEIHIKSSLGKDSGRIMMKFGLVLLVVLGLSSVAYAAKLDPWSLNGIWTSDDGGIYYLRQIGDTIWWAGFSTESYGGMDDFNRGLKFTNVFNGIIKNNSIIGKWADVPKGEIMQNGELSLEIITEPEFKQIVGLKKLGSQPFGGSVWRRYTGITDSTCGNLKAWSTDVVCKFDNVLKSGGDSLLDNLAPFKDNVVLFGWSKSPLTLDLPHNAGRSPTDFCNYDDGDGDITFYMQANRAELDSQPNFWTSGWISGNIVAPYGPWPTIISKPDYIKRLLGDTSNYIHPELIMYGMTGCTSKAIFPGWEQDSPNSILWNGFPIAGFVNFVSNNGNSVTIGGASLDDKYIRITGVLVGMDYSHIYDEGNPPWGRLHPTEIHPVYSIDVIQNFKEREPNSDLTGVWSATDVGTYYIRQIGNEVWWLGLSRDQGRSFANVFHGTIRQTGKFIDDSPKKLIGEWADIPLGNANNNGNITLQGKLCLPDSFIGNNCTNNVFFNQQNFLETKFTSNGVFDGYNWKKMYDRNIDTNIKVS